MRVHQNRQTLIVPQHVDELREAVFKLFVRHACRVGLGTFEVNLSSLALCKQVAPLPGTRFEKRTSYELHCSELPHMLGQAVQSPAIIVIPRRKAGDVTLSESRQLLV